MTIEVGDEVRLCNLGSLNGLKVIVRAIEEGQECQLFIVSIQEPAPKLSAWSKGDELEVHRYELQPL